MERAVDIVAIDFDWHYSLAVAEDCLEPNEKPMPLGADGFVGTPRSCASYAVHRDKGRGGYPLA
ncbi:hypothetical protein FACS189487_10180 [Campylobacterota bacterium]|nr:hypothetical protein FACS189487_10180 [Campylobacterota bacterium]